MALIVPGSPLDATLDRGLLVRRLVLTVLTATRLAGGALCLQLESPQ
jgi:hypothetical protein